MKKILAIVLFFASCIPALISNNINVPLVKQSQTHWCWAAAGAMVYSYVYNHPIKDCQVASLYWEKSKDCCANGISCDRGLKAAHFKALLTYQMHLPVVAFEGTMPTFDQIAEGIDAEQIWVVITLTEVATGTGHVAVVTGYHRDGAKLFVNDSSTGQVIIDYKDLFSGRFGEWVYAGRVGREQE
jgi:hypothetical protein